MDRPGWMSLLSPLPGDCVAERKPVAAAEQIERGTAGPIEGWHNVIVNLSKPGHGLRHVQITLDAHDNIVAAGDHVMLILEMAANGVEVARTEHLSIGGSFAEDGSFRGTHWHMLVESRDGENDANVTRKSDRRAPTDEEIAALRRIIDDVLARERR
jgi:hypothetical protein